MPVRKVSNRGGNVIGKFPSIKLGRMIAFESLLERDFIYLLDYEEEVEWFEEQPLTIEYEYDGKILHYTPDFHLTERGREVLVECKPEKFVSNLENQRKAAAAHDWCVGHDWEYRVVTDQQIRKGYRLENVKQLTRYARQLVEPAMRGRIYALISNYEGQMTIDVVIRALSTEDTSGVFAAILHMLFHHELCAQLGLSPISGQTSISFPLKHQKEGRP